MPGHVGLPAPGQVVATWDHHQLGPQAGRQPLGRCEGHHRIRRAVHHGRGHARRGGRDRRVLAGGEGEEGGDRVGPPGLGSHRPRPQRRPVGHDPLGQRRRHLGGPIQERAGAPGRGQHGHQLGRHLEGGRGRPAGHEQGERRHGGPVGGGHRLGRDPALGGADDVGTAHARGRQSGGSRIGDGARVVAHPWLRGDRDHLHALGHQGVDERRWPAQQVVGGGEEQHCRRVRSADGVPPHGTSRGGRHTRALPIGEGG